MPPGRVGSKCGKGHKLDAFKRLLRKSDTYCQKCVHCEGGNYAQIYVACFILLCDVGAYYKNVSCLKGETIAKFMLHVCDYRYILQ